MTLNGRAARKSAERAETLPAALGIALVWFASAGALAQTDPPASFRIAPESVESQRLLLDVDVNGIPRGHQLVEVATGRIGLSPTVRDELGLESPSTGGYWIGPGEAVVYKLDLARSVLSLRVPSSRLQVQRIAPDFGGGDAKFSPETWGAFINYDFNARRTVGSAAAGATAFGGLADLHLLGPDLIGSFGLSYDTAEKSQQSPIRLETRATWRPAWTNLAISAGDSLPPRGPMAATRTYRFGGVQVGTDSSGAPDWAAAPIASVAGSAQPQSVLDLYMNGQRSFSTVATGGPYSLTLPAGGGGGGASLLVTDVTGRSVLLPIDLPRVDAQLLRPGGLRWSVGVGAPRFGFGTPQSSYAAELYSYAGGRYGFSERLTLRAHLEAGPKVANVEFGSDLVATPRLALRGTIAGSRSDRGLGGSGRIGIAFAGPKGFSLDATLAHKFGAFDDVVSVSGRRQATRIHGDPRLTLPPETELSGRLAWRATDRLGLAVSYQRATNPGTGAVGLASFNVDYTVASLPLFLNAFRTEGRHPTASVLAGVALHFGAIQGSVSAGVNVGETRAVTGSATFSRSMQDEAGSVGWNLFATRHGSAAFLTADAQTRTGYGSPGIAVQSFGRTSMGTVTMRGTAGLVGGHPFTSDPVQGGIIVVDAGRSGLPVRLNGVDRGRTSFDGKLAIGGAVPGTPQSVSIDTEQLPFDAQPTITEDSATTRAGGATVLSFAVHSAQHAAQFSITLGGGPPPLGATITGKDAAAPVGKDGRVYLPSIKAGEVLQVDLPDGRTCSVHTNFDGQGGVSRRLGTLPCVDVRG